MRFQSEFDANCDPKHDQIVEPRWRRHWSMLVRRQKRLLRIGALRFPVFEPTIVERGSRAF
jgi:hypothetical protein